MLFFTSWNNAVTMHWCSHPAFLAGSYPSHVGCCHKSTTADPACCWLCSLFPSQNIFCFSLQRDFIWEFGFQSQQDHYGVPSQDTIPEQVVLGVFISGKVSPCGEALLFLFVTQTKWSKSKLLSHTAQSISRYWRGGESCISSYSRHFCKHSELNSFTEINISHNYFNLLSVKSNCLSAIILASCLHGYIPLASPYCYTRIFWELSPNLFSAHSQ